MRTYLQIMLFSFLSAYVMAQAEVINLNAFDRLDVATSVDVTLYEGSPKAELNIVRGEREDFVIKNDGGNLLIKFKSKKWGWSSGNRHAKVKLWVEDLRGIEASAGASVDGDIVLKADKFEAEASSGASLSLGLDVSRLVLEVSSGASAALDGQADRMTLEASSGASVKAKRLKTKNTNVEVSSGASAKIWCTSELSAEASSGGSVSYKGDPTDTDIDVGKYSGGSVRKI